LEEPDPRCAAHLSLRRLDEALSLCADADNYQLCPIYRQKLRGETAAWPETPAAPTAAT